MTANPETLVQRKVPTIADAFVFRAKTMLLQIRRAVIDRASSDVVRHAAGSKLTDHPIIATSRTRLWTEDDPRERFLVAGKIQNLRLVIRKLDGLEIPAGGTFSFWKQIGRASRFKGFVEGRELREGCIIPNIGGGLCQLSNALYDAALQANCEIVERHAHTQVIAGSLAEQGRDATVFWNYVDLRFRSSEALRIEASLDSKDLVIRFRGVPVKEKALHKIERNGDQTPNPNSCATCEVGDCHRVVDAAENAEFGRTVYLVDEHSPEFDAYLQADRAKGDRLMLPLDGRRFRKANYAWTTGGFEKVSQSLWITAKRSYRSRKLATQGAARQLNLLRMYEELADSYARRLTYDATHVVVHQNLLPYLWSAGHLGGRTFDVLMSALPMHEIQRRLDHAHELHPQSKTLGDFRADAGLLAAERDALQNARRLITPHTEIARLFPRPTVLLAWQTPSRSERGSRQPNEKPVVVFPASTVGRKGCYELRDALRGIDAKLIVLGPLIEGSDFWDGFDQQRGGDNWLEIADLVVLPAFIEHRPRRLLLAAASGIPVLASSACGVEGVPNITTIPAGEISTLREKIKHHLRIT